MAEQSGFLSTFEYLHSQIYLVSLLQITSMTICFPMILGVESFCQPEKHWSDNQNILIVWEIIKDE